MTKLVRALLGLILLMATIANLGTDLKQGCGALLIVLASLAQMCIRDRRMDRYRRDEIGYIYQSYNLINRCV